MKRLTAIFIILGIMACCCASCTTSAKPDKEQEDTTISTEPAAYTAEGTDTEEGQSTAELSFLQKEKENDPIFE